MCRYATYTGIAVVALIAIALLFQLLLPDAFAFATHSISHILLPFGNSNNLISLGLGVGIIFGVGCLIGYILEKYLKRSK